MKSGSSVVNRWSISSFAAVGLIAVAASEVQFSVLPPKVQKAVNANLDVGVVWEVDRRVNEGRALYQVEIRREGSGQQLLLDANGRLLRSGSAGDSRVNANPD